MKLLVNTGREHQSKVTTSIMDAEYSLIIDSNVPNNESTIVVVGERQEIVPKRTSLDNPDFICLKDHDRSYHYHH
jgi:hypothetical protein